MMFTSTETTNKHKNIVCYLCNNINLPKLYIISNEFNSTIILCPECKKAFSIFLGYDMQFITSSKELMTKQGQLVLYNNLKL